MGKNRKDMGKAWQSAHTALVEIEDGTTAGIEFSGDFPNTSIHIIYNNPEPGSLLATSGPVLSEAAKVVRVITRTLNYYIIRRNRGQKFA
jgi:hypothetical protein